MAYDARQLGIIAHAFALTGGNIPATARFLRDNCVEGVDCSETTLRRLRDKPEFAAQVEHERTIIAEERDEATRRAERERLKRDVEGSFGDRIKRMEGAWWDLCERLMAQVESPDADKREMLALFSKLQEFILRMKAQATPAIAELWQAEALIRSYQKVLMKKCGAALCEQIQRDVGKEYQASLASEQARAAEAENGSQSEAAAATA